jgi:hypothetical protein
LPSATFVLAAPPVKVVLVPSSRNAAPPSCCALFPVSVTPVNVLVTAPEAANAPPLVPAVLPTKEVAPDRLIEIGELCASAAMAPPAPEALHAVNVVSAMEAYIGTPPAAALAAPRKSAPAELAPA